jgi:CPA2 family monovalent cation:H+ antiporter-2
MDHAQGFLLDLALVLGVAAFTTVLFQKMRQPVVLGYLLAGMIVGPHTPIPIFVDPKTIEELAEWGVILLMFSIGLEIRVSKLIKLAPTTGLIAVLQCALMIWLGYVMGRWLGWTTLESLYAGAVIAISSTTIIAKVFEESGIKGSFEELVYGILIFEDLIAVLLMAVFPAISAGKNVSVGEFSKTLGYLALFLAAMLVVGMLLVPRLTRIVVRMKRPETITIFSIGLCFTLAILAKVCGYSVALGAFLAGALVAESGEEHTIEHSVRPVKDVFSAVFFVTVGMLINPAAMAEHWGAILIFTGLVIVGKLIGVSVSSFMTGYNVRTSVRAGMSLAQIGEFSFIIAGVGIATGAIGNFIYSLAVAVSAATTLTTPWLIRSSDAVAKYVDRKLPKPLQTFVCLYGSWISRLRQPKKPLKFRSQVLRFTALLLVDVSCLVVIILGVSVWLDTLIGYGHSYFPLKETLIRGIILLTAAALAAPFVIGVIRCSRGLGLNLAADLLPKNEGGALDLAAAPRKVFVVTVQVAILSAVGFLLLLLSQPFLPLGYGLAAFSLGILIFGILFWKNAENLQGHVTAGAQMILEILSSNPSGRATNLAEQVEKTLPGLGTVTSVKLAKTDKAVGKTLAQVNLRGMTGASVIAIKRTDQDIATPSAHEKLQTGDVLVMTGSDSAIAAAREVLS